jgi:hypothetical protein
LTGQSPQQTVAPTERGGGGGEEEEEEEEEDKEKEPRVCIGKY